MSVLRRAFAANIVPACALWFFVALLLGFYQFHAPTRAFLESLAAFKTRLGLGFSMPAQALAAGFLPFVFQKFQSGSHRKTRAAHLPFLMLFFALMGGVVDKFYGFQTQIFGSGTDFRTVALKTVCDLALFTPFFVMPLIVWAFAFKDNDFSLARTRAFMGWDWIVRRVWPLYCAALIVWVPLGAVLYSLPLALQFPFQAIVQCFWGLIIVVVTARAPEKT